MAGSGRLLSRTPRDYPDVLQNIEFVLVSGYQQDDTIDDRTVARALHIALGDNEKRDVQVDSLVQSLDGIREFQTYISGKAWSDCLRTVLQSVHRHSNCKPGITDYLEFVSNFIR